MQQLIDLIRNVPDFPRPGIQFKDITPLLKQPDCVREATSEMIKPFKQRPGEQSSAAPVSAVCAIEARGFIFGCLAAQLLNAAFIPLRKPGKLPHQVAAVDYELEYGAAALEMHTDAVGAGDAVLLVDDLLATGGTALAGCELLERLGAQVIACTFLIELGELDGRQRLTSDAGYRVHSLIRL